jgi:hypothetical protein
MFRSTIQGECATYHNCALVHQPLVQAFNSTRREGGEVKIGGRDCNAPQSLMQLSRFGGIRADGLACKVVNHFLFSTHRSMSLLCKGPRSRLY